MRARAIRQPPRLTRLVITVMCLLILPFNILSIFLGGIVMRNLWQSFQNSIQISLRTQTNQLEQRLKNIDYFIYDRTTNNADFIRYAQTSGDWHHYLYRNNAIREMENAMQLSENADAMFIYHPDWNDLCSAERFYIRSDGNPGARLKREALETLFQSEDVQLRVWQLLRIGDEDYLLRIVPQNGYYMGAYISCEDYLDKLYRESAIPGADYALASVPPETPRGSLQCSSPLKRMDAALYCTVTHRMVTSSASVWMVALVILAILSVIMIPLCLILFRRSIDRPLAVLRAAFRELESGKEDYRIESPASSEEFAETYSSFNSMADTTERLRAAAMEEQKKRYALEVHNLNLQLENLQLKIRPHFLQNMMNLLFTLIQNRRVEEAQELVLYLSRYFRLMFRKGRELAPFDEELELVREYLRVSGMHYINAFTVSWQLDPMLSLISVPPLMLHSFVENILHHALIPGQTVHIVIDGEYDEEEEAVTLRVSDDGRGMDPEFARMINEKDFSSLREGEHLGIRNAIDRLNFYYQDRGTVSVESALGEGTTFTLRFPYTIPAEEMTDIDGKELTP